MSEPKRLLRTYILIWDRKVDVLLIKGGCGVGVVVRPLEKSSPLCICSIPPHSSLMLPSKFGTIDEGIIQFFLRYPLWISVSMKKAGVGNILVPKYARTRCTSEARSLTLCLVKTVYWWCARVTQENRGNAMQYLHEILYARMPLIDTESI